MTSTAGIGRWYGPYKSQQDAFVCCQNQQALVEITYGQNKKNCGGEKIIDETKKLHVFAKEVGECGQRVYYVTDYPTFFASYDKFSAKNRCYYELIEEHSHCRLYFELSCFVSCFVFCQKKKARTQLTKSLNIFLFCIYCCFLCICI